MLKVECPGGDGATAALFDTEGKLRFFVLATDPDGNLIRNHDAKEVSGGGGWELELAIAKIKPCIDCWTCALLEHRGKIYPLEYDRDEHWVELLEKAMRESELEGRVSKCRKSRRDNIPQKIRRSVWRRDEGKCVECGSNERLEFDHVIPVSKGGSNTERNIQLLCEHCNRSKGAQI